MDRIPITGFVHWKVLESGLVVREGLVPNLVTDIGDRMYGERGSGMSAAPAPPTGMKLGTGIVAPAKNGAAAALGSYLANSDEDFDLTYPQSAPVGGKRQVVYRTTWAPGKATTASPITEIVIVNEALANVTSLAAATIARALVPGVSSKASNQGLVATWTHVLGA